MASATIICPSCGVENSASDTVCFFCRHKLSGADSAPTIATPPQNQAHQPLQAHPAQAPHTPIQAVPTQHTPAQPIVSQPQAQNLLNGRYHIMQAIGKGGMGAVYLAQDTLLGNRLVAVKEMSESGVPAQDLQLAVETFKREAYLLAGLQHPNLPSIHDHFSQAGRWYLVMSFIQGETLAHYLARSPNGRLPLAEALHIARELCDVLNYLHSQRPPIIFRDLKPSNIMRTPDGHIYLIDFGIARLFKPGQAKDTASYGSMGYSPPEQYGRAQTNERSDIYSLGVTLYEMLSGYDPSQSPFRFPPLQTLVPSVPARFSQLIMQMVEMDENRRPTSIKAVQQVLQ